MQDNSDLIDMYRMLYPDISDEDIQAFIVAKPANEPYVLGVDSKKQAGAPEGTVTKYHLDDSKVYPCAGRDYWIYVPAQYDAAKPACLMIFQDGVMYLYDPAIRANIALDNLIHKKEIPVIIGLFINPGDKGPGIPVWGGDDNRSFEYDAVTDRYSTFLIEEILPILKRDYNITSDPKGIAIAGISSGGICAFNAAWHRPDVFGKVISHCGSFVNFRGGDQYPGMVRNGPAKPIKVFLQSGENDFNASFGSLPLMNKEMAAALANRGYDHKFVFGQGGHSLKHGGAILPETLRWIWSDHPNG